MATWIPGIPGNLVDQFFTNLILSDVRMPHTTTAISPITFTNFMTRNQVYTVRLMDAYHDLNKFWKKYLEHNPDLEREVLKRVVDLDVLYNDRGGWHPFINHLLAVADVDQMSDPYYQMHYLAHACARYYADSDSMTNAMMLYRERSIFNDLIGPILYDPIIPTSYVFMPVMNYRDIRFSDKVPECCAKIRGFIEGHRSTIDHETMDRRYCDMVKKWSEEAMTGLTRLKYDDPEHWKRVGNAFFARVNTLHSDLQLFEMYNTFERDGLDVMKVVKMSDKLEKKFTKNIFDDASDLIDELLDIRSAATKGVQK